MHRGKRGEHAIDYLQEELTKRQGSLKGAMDEPTLGAFIRLGKLLLEANDARAKIDNELVKLEDVLTQAFQVLDELEIPLSDSRE